MTRIGLLSDTHSYLDPAIFGHFDTCQEVWHAGDVGAPDVSTQLANFRPLRIVSGNIDSSRDYPADLRFNLEGFPVWITHIGGVPPRYNPVVGPLLRANTPRLFVCGHSHILKVVRDPALGGMLYLNPGAAGRSGFHTQRTCLRFTLHEGEISNMQVIELGTR